MLFILIAAAATEVPSEDDEGLHAWALVRRDKEGYEVKVRVLGGAPLEGRPDLKLHFRVVT